MKARTVKHALLLLLQLAVTAGALFYLFHDAHRRAQMAGALRHADWRWLAAGLCAYGVLEILAVARWLLLLRIQGFSLPWLKAVAILFIGEFFTTCTPGLIGGDAMRIFYLAKEAPEKKLDAALTVMMDRIIGLASLITLAGGVLTLRYRWLSHAPAAARLVEAMIALLGAGVLLLALALILVKFHAPAAWPIPESVRQVTTALQRYGTDWRRTLGAFAATLLAHGCYYATFCFAALALTRFVNPAPSFAEVFSVMPIVNTLVALPISLAGIGLRESLFQVLLHELTGTPEGVGALIGSTGYAIQVFWALPGAAALFGYRALTANPAPRPA